MLALALPRCLKEWAANFFGIRILILTGKVTEGSYCTEIFQSGPSNETKKEVWLVNHNIHDGAGKPARHFTLISKDPVPHWFQANIATEYLLR